MEINVIGIIWRNGAVSYALMAVVCSCVWMGMVLKANILSKISSLLALNDVIWQHRAWSSLPQVMAEWAAPMLTIEPWHPLWHNFKILQDIISKKGIWKNNISEGTMSLRYFIIINPLNRYMSCHKGTVAFLYRNIMHHVIVNTLRPQQILTHFLDRHYYWKFWERNEYD